MRKYGAILILALGAGAARAQVPGDRSKLTAPHPGYDLATLMPAGLQPGVTGMDFLSDGRLVLRTWGGNHLALTPPSRKGEIYIVSNIDAEDVSKITYTRFATGLQEPLGLKVVSDTIYVSERQALAELVDENGNGVLDSGEYRKVAAYASGAPPSPYDKLPYNPPAVMLQQSELANAPGQPVYVVISPSRGYRQVTSSMSG